MELHSRYNSVQLIMAASSRGQDGWLSPSKRGFECPCGYQRRAPEARTKVSGVSGPIVYWLGWHPLKVREWVQFPLGLPTLWASRKPSDLPPLAASGEVAESG